MEIEYSPSGNLCRKVSKINRYFFCFLFFLFLAPCVSYAQGAKTVSLSVKNETLQHVLEQVEAQSSYRFAYRDVVLPGGSNITIAADKMPIETFLNSVLAKTNLTYQRNGDTFSIVRKTQSGPLTVKGVVKDETGAPMVGVAVIVKNTSKGTATDKDGKYSIVSPADGTLDFQYIGYKTVEETLNGRAVVDVTMNMEAAEIDDVVVIGYGTMRKKDLTGSVGSMNTKDIMETSPLSFVNAMQGRLSGVQISSSSGELGAASRITIRGSNSVYGSSLPLYVIDGVQMEMNSDEIASASMGERSQLDPMSSINPADIESIEVLKDASATAIYGSRGANGVVIVTTKSGRAGRARVTYDGNVSLGYVSKRLDMLGAADFIDYRQIVDPDSPLFWKDSNGDGSYNENDQAVDPYAYPTHDWQSEMLRTAVSHNHNLSMDGGSEKTQFSTSLGYTNNQGIILDNSLQRITARVRLTNQSLPRLKLGTNVNTSYTTFNGVSHSGGDGGTFNGVVQSLVTTRPVEIYIPSWDRTGEYVSPISMLQNAYKLTSLMRTNINTTAEYQIMDGLKFNVDLGGYLSSSKGNEFYGKNTEWGAGVKGSATVSEQRAYYISNTEQLSYQKQFGESRLDAMVAFEINQYNFESFNINNQNYLDESSGVWNIGNGSIINGYGSYRGVNNRLSYLGRVYYDLKNRYLFTASLRIDGSDKFGPGKRYGYFPSVAFAWRLSEEKFLKNASWLDNLKLRLSYGRTGNERIASYQYMANMESNYYNGILGMSPATMANPNLKWETTSQYNVGLDFSVLNNRINLSVDAYLKLTDDMLMPAIIPSQSGFSQQWQNIGRVDNKGLEFQLSTVNVQTKDFEWTTDFNISTNKNIVRDLGGVDYRPTSVGGGFITSVGRVYKGNQIGTAYGYVFDGVYQMDEFTWQDNSDPTIPFEERTFQLKPGVTSVAGAILKPGSLKFKNFNPEEDNVVDENDMKIISRSSPKIYGGFSNTFRFKGLELSVFFTGMYGNQIFNESRFRMEGAVPYTWLNITKDFWENRWTPDNPTNARGNFASETLNPTAAYASSYYVEDASFLRLKTLTLSYTLPQSLIRKISPSRISNVRIYVTGENLYTWTNYSGFDPEIDSGNPLLTGFDRISYPRTRSVIFGLSITF